MRVLLAGLVLMVACSAAASVGFRSLPVAADALAPTRLNLWFPARPGTGRALRFRDYVGVNPTDDSALRETYQSSRGVPLTQVAFSEWLEQSVAARADAEPGARAPLIVLAGGMNAPVHLFTRSAEVLAAKGFAVAALPSFSRDSGTQLDFSADSFAIQVAGIEASLALLRQQAEVDPEQILLGGWSVGGLAAVVVAARSDVIGLISLDSGFGYDYGPELLASQALRLACFDKPLLHITSTRPGRFRVAKSRASYEALPAQAFWATIPGLSHAEFTDDYGLASPAPADRARLSEGQGRWIDLVVGFSEAISTRQVERFPDHFPTLAIETLVATKLAADCPERD